MTEEEQQTKTKFPNDIEVRMNELLDFFFSNVLKLCYESGQKQFNYIKKTVKTPEGGTYLFQVQHVTGPKIDLEFLFKPKEEDKNINAANP